MTDEEQIADLLSTFFAAFSSGPGVAVRVDALRQVFLPGAVIVRAGGGEPVRYDVEGFLAPRQELLSDGTLTDFREWSTGGRTDVFGDIAHHYGSYAKAGRQGGAAFTGRGMKTLQFIRTSAGWRISAVAWDDEREGVPLPSDHAA